MPFSSLLFAADLGQSAFMHSHTSNGEVFETAGSQKHILPLLYKQLMLSQVADQPSGDFVLQQLGAHDNEDARGSVGILMCMGLLWRLRRAVLLQMSFGPSHFGNGNEENKNGKFLFFLLVHEG